MESNLVTVSEVLTGIQAAVRAAGGQGKMATALGVSQQAVSLWLRRGYVPPRHIVQIETLYGVPRARLINPKIADLLAPLGDGL